MKYDNKCPVCKFIQKTNNAKFVLCVICKNKYQIINIKDIVPKYSCE